MLRFGYAFFARTLRETLLLERNNPQPTQPPGLILSRPASFFLLSLQDLPGIDLGYTFRMVETASKPTLRWIPPPAAPEISPELLAAAGGSDLLARLLAQRGLADPLAARRFLNPDEYTPASPYDLPGMSVAVARLQAALQAGERILVWGDFDVDGQTSTAVLVETLRRLGARPDYHVPVRARESHGVGLPVLKEYLAQGIDLLLTCDTGISAHEALEYAAEVGLPVIVTDHHELPDSLPPALAHLTPRLLPPGHPASSLPGVGAALLLAQALLEEAGQAQHLPALFDLAALGIVADAAVLRGDARYYVQRGLEVLRTTARPGLQALFEFAELDPARLTEEHIGFAIAPRLNALGRLNDANPAVELLTTADPARARLLASSLEGFNARRKLLSDQVFKACLDLLNREPALLQTPALVLAQPNWPPGVIGIVASRLVERYQRPVVLIASPPDEPARGSARSIAGVNISHAIAAARHLLLGFGGHPMAAGLSLEAENITEFRLVLGRAVAAQLALLPPHERQPGLHLDAELPLSALTEDTARHLERLAPFGQGNPSPALFCRALRLSGVTSLGRSQEHLLAKVADQTGQTYSLLWWQAGGLPQPAGLFDLAYSARLSTYQGRLGLQIEWLDYQDVDDSAAQRTLAQLPITDLRQHPNPLLALQELATAGGDWLLWAEAEARQRLASDPQLPLVGRDELRPAETLVIWSIPPARQELATALRLVQPRQVILFAADPQMDEPAAFLKRLGGLVKAGLGRAQTEFSLERFAAATAQCALTVELGIAWLAARRVLPGYTIAGGLVIFTPGSQPAPAPPDLDARLRRLLDESAAYRQYYCTAAPQALFGE